MVGILALLALPLVAGEGEKSWRRRPVAVLTVVFAAVIVGDADLARQDRAVVAVMDAWSALPVPEAMVEKATPLERQGALVFQAKQCRNCHALGGTGGRRGPRSTTWRRD